MIEQASGEPASGEYPSAEQPFGEQTPAPVARAPQPAAGPEARAVVAEHGALATRAARILAELDGKRARVVEIIDADREGKVRDELAGLGVDRLSELTEKNLRIGALSDAGYVTVRDLLDADPALLETFPGIGQQTARSAVAAADQLAEVLRASHQPRIELDPGNPTWTELLTLLDVVGRLASRVEPHRQDLTDYAGSVLNALPAARLAGNRLTYAFRRRATKDAARTALGILTGWKPWLEAKGLRDVVGELESLISQPAAGALGLWTDFENRAAAFYAILGEIVPLGTDLAAANGLLPAELVARINEHPLDQSLLTVHLRGYQVFGAKFALSQGRSFLGDEMGLGKTVQAIAAMGHLAADGHKRFLVVCPASVLVNWLREVRLHSTLGAHRLHGADREAGIAAWMADGGVGVTTFGSLKHVPFPNPTGYDSSSREPTELGMLVVDEAHYVKNPRANRSRRVAEWTARSGRVLFMTGTPMENRLEEFTNLVDHLDPRLVAGLPPHLGLVGPDLFRAQMAPVYLRRNQADVLIELPDLVVTHAWDEFSSRGQSAYQEAVASGSFMTMRRAAFATAHPRDSSKLARLREIVTEARDGGHKVLVFSFFRDVLDLVTRTLQEDALAAGAEARVFGPLTGSVPPDDRQQLVDSFTAAAPGSVLVSQIQAGGVGLNVQAASVVVLCEPQLKPTAEAQAIARVHRMGQVRTVQVHRLLIERSVDERIVELLKAKSLLFDTYVRDSSLADQAIQAVDVTEAQLAREVVTAEQTRLGYGPEWDELATIMAADGG